ncbi:Mth938-like domain-containing protein [Coprothermobacter platensis]|uniref:Mth938-like domain-containing protein n=1 Tax=Coprothermobacter platensis TaxID=108819 RepID=UPI00036655BC|nr:Mth938-like domain-containing protein [Coprothermobacter platensis]
MIAYDLAFGELLINGKSYRNDVMLIGENPKTWIRPEIHEVNIEDVIHAIPPDVSYVVFGIGFHGRMFVSPDIANVLRKQGIACIEQKTPQALQTYDKLVNDGQRAVAFLHLGC